MEVNTEKKSRRRSSIFAPKNTALVTPNLNYPPDYVEKLKKETSEWKQVVAETMKDLHDCKKLYPANAIEKLDKSILSKEQQEFLEGAIEYDDYLSQVQKVCDKASVIVAIHNSEKEALKLSFASNERKVKKLNEILLSKMNAGGSK